MNIEKKIWNDEKVQKCLSVGLENLRCSVLDGKMEACKEKPPTRW